MRTLIPLTLALAACTAGSRVSEPEPGVEPHNPTQARPMPEPLEPRPFTTPKAERRTLSNGLPVVVVTNNEVPVVQVTLALRVGEYTAPTPGLAQATFSMLDEGAGDLDSEEISRKLKAMASDLGARAGDDGASVSTSAMKRYLDPTLDLFALVVREPTFPKDEWGLLQTRYVTAIQNARKDPTAIAQRVQDVAFHGDTYRGRVAMESDYQGITPDDMRAWYAGNVGPKNGILLVGGDTTADEIVPLLEARLGDWDPEGVQPPPDVAPATSPEAEVLYLIDKPGAAQSVVQAMRVVGERTDEDWYPYNMAIDVFGGTFMSRLNMNLREDKGYTYGARCSTSTRYGPSVLRCSASVQTEVTGPSLDEMRKEFKEVLSDRPITDEELAYMKSTRINQYPARFETPGALLGEQETIWRYGLPEDWPERYLPAVEAVSVDAARTALASKMAQGQTAWLVVGDKATILPAVESFGLPIVELDADGKKLGEPK